MPNIREWYERVNAAWPETIPALSASEAERAARRLYRFALKRTFRGSVRVSSGNRRNYVRRGSLTVNPSLGWHELIHDLSHDFHFRLSTDKPHSKSHARLELRLVREVVRRGWLDDRVKDRPAAAPPAAPSPALLRYDRVLAGIARWESKERRAKTALRKLRQRAGYYRRTYGDRDA